MDTKFTVIIPIHRELVKTELELLNNSIKSLENQTHPVDEVLFVSPKNTKLTKQLGKLKHNLPVKFVENSGDVDFHSQVNLGVNNANNNWFSVLEFDDEYSSKWFQNANTYIKAYEDVSLFLPITIDTDDKHNLLGTTNEIVWANSFSDKVGFLNNSALLEYQAISLGGSVINKDKFLEVGSFKNNISLFNSYEFLLRATFNNASIMVIPKYGYKHMNLRENSQTSVYKAEINEVEAKWWLSRAKKEFYFTKQRNISTESLTKS